MSSGFGVLRVLLRALLVLLLHLRGVAPVGFWSQEGTSNTGTEKSLKEVPRPERRRQLSGHLSEGLEGWGGRPLSSDRRHFGANEARVEDPNIKQNTPTKASQDAVTVVGTSQATRREHARLAFLLLCWPGCQAGFALARRRPNLKVSLLLCLDLNLMFRSSRYLGPAGFYGCTEHGAHANPNECHRNRSNQTAVFSILRTLLS